MMLSADDCGRSLAKPLWYQPPVHDWVPQNEADVLRVDNENGNAVLVIHTTKQAPVRTSGMSEYHQVRSVDRGKTWEPFPQDVPTPLAIRYSSFLQAPSDPKLLYRYVRELGLYLRSGDGGLSWVLPKYLIAGEGRDRFASRIAGTNLDTVRFEITAICPRNPLTIFASLIVAPWTTVTLYYPDFLHPDGGVAKQLEDTYVSHDGGDIWEKFTSELRPEEPMGVSSSPPSVFYGHGRRGIVKSVDSGATWAPVGQQRELELRPLTMADKDVQTRLLKGLVDLRVGQILVDPANENIVYLVSNKGLIRSADGGSTWYLLNLGFDQIDSVNSIALNPAQPAEVFVGTTHGVFYSPDRGCHFSRIYPSGRPTR